MVYFKRAIIWQFIMIAFLPIANGQNLTSKDYYKTAGELGIFLYTQYGPHTEVSNLQNMSPNSFDKYFRDQLLWSGGKMDDAKAASDILLYGVFVGTIPMTPLLSNDDYMSMLITNIEVMSINGTITNLVKNIVKRQRPASFFKTRDEGEDAYRSFFSGHTSSAFAIGTSTAIMLSRSNPSKKNHIWAGCMGLATATGYFRLAADKHYMTDVLTGALTGILIGNYVQNKRSNEYLSVSLSNLTEGVQFQISIKLD